MKPILLPVLERQVHRSLLRAGFRAATTSTPLGRVHHYDASGTGDLPTVVFLHGMSASAGGFAPVLSRMRSRARRVVAIDYPGHGRSEDPRAPLTVKRLLETTSNLLADVVREPALLVGNSAGGAVAVNHAATHPDRVRGLVLMSPSAPATPSEIADVRRMFGITTRKEAMDLVHRVHHRAPFLARLIAHELPAAARPAVRDLIASIETVDEGAIATAVGSLAMPILLWWGRSERLLPPRQLAWWRAHLPPHAVVEEPHGIGHCPHLDDPARVASRIASFASELGAAAWRSAGSRPTPDAPTTGRAQRS